jgi:hypothetical protein
VAILTLALVAAAGGGCGGGDSKDHKKVVSFSDALPGKVAQAEHAVKAEPNNPQLLKQLALLQVQYAYRIGNPQANTLGTAGVAALRKAAASWTQYLALKPKEPDTQLATIMARAYSQAGLNDPRGAIRAMEVAAANTKPPSGSVYAQLALLYFNARQFREGDLATARALKLTPASERQNLRRAIGQVRSQAKKQGR